MDEINHTNEDMNNDHEMTQPNSSEEEDISLDEGEQHQQRMKKSPSVYPRRRPGLPRYQHITSFRHKYPQLLTSLHPTLKISYDLINVVDSVINHLFHRIASEARELANLRKRQTILYHDIESACRLIFPSEIYTHVKIEATKSIHRYKISK
ncbi:histone-fold-containing protein [Cunninghamella echinulata]|nr:histone-fold-containing protein [Cunninghamella echinulata]